MCAQQVSGVDLPVVGRVISITADAGFRVFVESGVHQGAHIVGCAKNTRPSLHSTVKLLFDVSGKVIDWKFTQQVDIEVDPDFVDTEPAGLYCSYLTCGKLLDESAFFVDDMGMCAECFHSRFEHRVPHV